MHYKDGTPAFIGDVVRGCGYNLKDDSGSLREFVGTVVGLIPGSKSCNIQNIQVAHVVITAVDSNFASRGFLYDNFAQKYVVGCGADKNKILARTDLEYGQCDTFELVLGFTVQCLCENKPVNMRPVVQGHELIAACNADCQYNLFRRDEHGGDTGFGAGEFIEVKNGDQFYCVQPATY